MERPSDSGEFEADWAVAQPRNTRTFNQSKTCFHSSLGQSTLPVAEVKDTLHAAGCLKYFWKHMEQGQVLVPSLMLW